MATTVIELDSMKLQSVLSTFTHADESVGGFVNFVIGTLADTFVIGGLTARDRFDGSLFFEQTNLATLIEMLEDVLRGKLKAPETSRFAYKGDMFFYKDERDDLRVGSQTVWTNPQHEPPTQVFIENLREHTNGALGRQYGMEVLMTPQTAQTMLAELQRIANEQ